MKKRVKVVKVEIDYHEFVIDAMYLMIKHIIGNKQANSFKRLNRGKK